MELPVVSNNPAIQKAYLELRQRGQSHNMADMLAHAQPPMSNTDREFLEGYVNGNQFEKNPDVGDTYRREAAAHGVDTTGKIYLSGLAAFPGDPRAWVSGRGDVQRVCEERGWACEGAVNVAAPACRQERKEVGIAPDLVKAEVDSFLADHPEATESRAELTEQVREMRKPHWAE